MIFLDNENPGELNGNQVQSQQSSDRETNKGINNLTNKTMNTENGTKTAKDTMTAKGTKAAKAEETKKDYKPKYTEEQKKALEVVTKVCEAEIKRVSEDKTFHGTKLDDNCIINLKEAYWEGKKDFGTPEINRIHGKDKQRTGESILSHGAQHILIVMTKKMADAAGIKSVRFSSDKKTEALPEDALIIMDGNGRIDWLLSQPEDVWSVFYGKFPSKDAAGYYNLPRAFDVINTDISVWKTENFVQKRLAYEGEQAHEGLVMINELLKKGYGYQAACELVALKTDRIPKNELVNGNDKATFVNFDCAKLIYEALQKAFGETKNTLKTKAVPKTITELWQRACVKNMRDDATQILVDFINSLSHDQADEINDAKAEKGGANRDTKRQALLEKAFFDYVRSNKITID